MGSSTKIQIAIGVRVERADLFVKKGPERRCKNMHTVVGQHAYCPRCGTPADPNTYWWEPGPLLRAIRAKVGESELRHESTVEYDEEGLGLHSIGNEGMPKYAPSFGWVVGYKLASLWARWNGKEAAAREVAAQDGHMVTVMSADRLPAIIAQATAFCHELGLDGPIEFLAVGWSS